MLHKYADLDGEDHELNVLQCMHLKLSLVAQIHTHTPNAYHSSTDDKESSLVIPGSFSIVIPDYGYIDNMNIVNVGSL